MMFKRMDYVLLLSLLCIATIGMVTLYAAVHAGDLSVWYKQGVYWLVGMLAFVVMCAVPLRLVGLAV
ncbi:MAG: rod shape-determining protein RodA, partial [Ghiorsea sp.]